MVEEEQVDIEMHDDDDDKDKKKVDKEVEKLTKSSLIRWMHGKFLKIYLMGIFIISMVILIYSPILFFVADSGIFYFYLCLHLVIGIVNVCRNVVAVPGKSTTSPDKFIKNVLIFFNSIVILLVIRSYWSGYYKFTEPTTLSAYGNGDNLSYKSDVYHLRFGKINTDDIMPTHSGCVFPIYETKLYMRAVYWGYLPDVECCTNVKCREFTSNTIYGKYWHKTDTMDEAKAKLVMEEGVNDVSNYEEFFEVFSQEKVDEMIDGYPANMAWIIVGCLFLWPVFLLVILLVLK